jgi:hypothetical protein
LGLVPARAEAQLTEDNAPFIAGIEVSGTVRVEAEAIYRQVALRAGMRLTSRALGEAGRAKMLAEFSVEAHARDLSATYRELL